MEGTVIMPDPAWNNDTPLLSACEGLHVGVAQCLYGHGAQQSITQGNAFGHTPLHYVCMCCDESNEAVLRCVALVEWLCSHGARECINGEDDDSNTPLLHALTDNHGPICEVLFRNAAMDTISTTKAWHRQVCRRCERRAGSAMA